MGYHTKSARRRIVRRLPVAAPALAGVAAALCLAPQALGNHHAAAKNTHTAPKTVPHTPSVANAAFAVTHRPARAAATRAAAAAAHQAASVARWYTVRSGDTLSSIAMRFYGKPSAWPEIYWANHTKLRWANVLQVGLVLRIPALPARIPAAPSALGPSAPAPAPAAVAAPAATAATATGSSYTSGGYPGGSFGACVVARESGGNAQVMNASGHYGLYQFSYSTWVAYGGNAADFGHASVAEQNQVFANALAAGGQSNWAPYDGC